jgi:hypothetical protein
LTLCYSDRETYCTGTVSRDGSIEGEVIVTPL